MDEQLSDGQLVSRLEAGDLDALGVLYERHKTCVYRTALAISHNASVAEDILQECFLRLHRYAYSIDVSLPLQPWLYRVTVNLSYDRERRRKRRQMSVDEAGKWLANSIGYSPEWRIEMSDMRSAVQDAIASLCINQRIPIILFYMRSLSLKEIALILECPVGTVKSRLHYGRESLRKKLAEGYRTSAELLPTLPHANVELGAVGWAGE